MPDNPNNASFKYSTTDFDVVTWNPAWEEWVPWGYNVDWDTAVELYQSERKHQPGFNHRVVRVEKSVKLTDMTDEIEVQE